MIFQDSRYQTGTVTPVLDSDGSYKTAVFPPTFEPPATFVTIRTAANTDLPTVANAAYGDPELWWHIAAANPQIFFPDNIPVNTLLIVPDLGSLK